MNEVCQQAGDYEINKIHVHLFIQRTRKRWQVVKPGMGSTVTKQVQCKNLGIALFS